MSPLLLVAVGFGGALGALCRSKATGFLKARTHGDFPAATLIINICSCTLAGIALAVQADLNEMLYLAATMGFLGGWSLFWVVSARLAPDTLLRLTQPRWAPQRSGSPSRARLCSPRAQLPPGLPRRWRGFRC